MRYPWFVVTKAFCISSELKENMRLQLSIIITLLSERAWIGLSFDLNTNCIELNSLISSKIYLIAHAQHVQMHRLSTKKQIWVCTFHVKIFLRVYISVPLSRLIEPEEMFHFVAFHSQDVIIFFSLLH